MRMPRTSKFATNESSTLFIAQIYSYQMIVLLNDRAIVL